MSSQQEVGMSNTVNPNVDLSPDKDSEEVAISTSKRVVEDDEDLSQPSKKFKTTSLVWQHFTKMVVDGHPKARCNHCGTKLVAKALDGTSHLNKHLRRCRRVNQPTMEQSLLKFQRQSDGSLTNLVTLDKEDFDKDVCRALVAKMVILHGLPLRFVEYEGFREMMNYAQPLFDPMSRRTLKNEIHKLFDSEKDRTMELFENMQARVVITTDMWTSTNQKKGYMVITAHFIDNSWKLHSRILRFVYVPAPHTAECLKEVLVKCLYDWNLERKLSTLTVDNCSTNDSMINLVVTRLGDRHLMLGGKLFHMRCCAHILSLIVKDGLDVIGESIEKVRDSVVYWTSTPKRIEMFEETARHLKVPLNKKLSLDCRTRWNSTYKMLSTALAYKDVFARLKERDSHYKDLPTAEEWLKATVVCEHLEKFYKLTEIISGTNYPIANKFFPAIGELRLSLTSWLISSCNKIQEMASAMIEKFEKYWNVIHGVLAVAVVLDPGCKMVMVEFVYKKIYGDDAFEHIEKVHSLCRGLVLDYQCRLGLDDGQREIDAILPITKGVAGEGVLGEFMIEFERHRKSTNMGLQKKSELDIYLEDHVISKGPDFDILLWWKMNKSKFPMLSAIARDILAIPVSTVASESAFSTSGRVLSPYRSRLLPDTLEALMCTQNWLWLQMRGVIPQEEMVGGESLPDDE